MTPGEIADRLWEEKRIEAVILRFGRSLDTGDWPAYNSCFTNPVSIDFERLTGQPEVRLDPALWTRFAEQIQSPVRRHHLYTNFDIDVDGDHARALVYMASRVWKATDRGVPRYSEYGWYDFRFERHQDGEWRMSDVRHDFQWVDGNPGIFQTGDPDLARTMSEVFCPAHVEAARQERARSDNRQQESVA